MSARGGQTRRFWWRVPRPGAGHFWPGRDFPFLCLRRVTFVNSDKSNQKRHSRGKGFRFPFPLEKPLSLKRPKGRGRDPSPLETSPGGVAIIKSRLCRFAAKVGGGQGPPFERRSCHETKNHTAPHFRAKAAAKREAETEKRPPGAKVPRAGARNVPLDNLSGTEGGRGVPRLRARRGDVGIAPYGRVQGARCWADRVVRPYE